MDQMKEAEKKTPYAYARVCKSGGTLLATYPACWVMSPVHLVRVAG